MDIPYKRKSLALTVMVGVLTLSACSDDDDSIEDNLQFHAEFADVVSMRQSGDDLLFTSGSTLYRLDAEGEYTLVAAAATSRRAFVEVVGDDHFILVNTDMRGLRESTDGGETWSFEFLSEREENLSFSGLNFHHDHLFVRFPEALIVTDTQLESFAIASGHIEPIPDSMYGLYNTIASQHDEHIWWSEREAAFDDKWTLKRLDLATDQTESFTDAGDTQLIDGFVDNDNPQTLVFGGVGGFTISHDNGESWHRVQLVETEGEVVEVKSVRQDSESGYYYANVSLTEIARVNEMWCSRDQGQTWTRNQFSHGTYGLRTEARAPMHIVERGGERRFVIPTRQGVVEGRLDSINCD